MIIVDSHEDLAFNSLTFGRDYLRSVEETRAAEAGTPTPERIGHALLGLPQWIEGRVAVIFTTLFAAPRRHASPGWDIVVYDDPATANQLYWSQVDFYRRWVEANDETFQIVTNHVDLAEVLQTWEAEANDEAELPVGRIGLVLLMEGADGIRDPGEVEAWFEAGVRIISPAWSGTRYAGGTKEPGPFTREGRALLEAMASTGLILDISHLSDEGALEALDQYEGPLIATHSNPRALVPHSENPERHLTDDAIRRLGERDGVMGILLGNKFLKDGWTKPDGREIVGLDDVTAHIDHVCQLLGDSDHVGIGSDFDGGFGLDSVPMGLDSIADLPLIGEALKRRGYEQAAVEAILGGNWLRVLRRDLPES